jgi:hypothetical protein
MENADILAILPKSIHKELFHAYNEILRNYREQRWEPSELNGGKLCEIIYTIIHGHMTGKIPDKSSKPKNFWEACKNLENIPNQSSRSLRIQIPRLLVGLYEIRNNRGVGHAGCEVNPNHMDAIAVLYMSKWLMSELVRYFDDVDTDKAYAAIEKIVEINIPVIWAVDGKLRVLDLNIGPKDGTLVLLYQASNGLTDQELIDNLEYGNPSRYRTNILKELHKKRYVEYNAETKRVKISPTGRKYVEENILNNK